jgi:hypothetical protein
MTWFGSDAMPCPSYSKINSSAPVASAICTKWSGVAVRKLLAERRLNLAESAYRERRPKPAT